MNEDIVFRAKVDDGGEGGKSLKTLQKEYKEINKELDKAVVGSEKYNAALKKLGAIKDDMGDLRDTINALNPEGKVGAFANVAGKLAGGFQAATGAAALFGVESEELEKTLLKVQAATAFAEGIRSLAGMSDAFNVVGTVIKTNVIPALTTLKGAIIATGIGALAVAIGVLIHETQEYNEAIEEEYGRQKKLNEELQKTTDAYLKQAKAAEEIRNAKRGGLNDLERELKLLEAQGATAAEIALQKQKIFDSEIYNLKVQRETVYDNAQEVDRINQKIMDKETEKTAAILAYQKAIADDQEKKAKEAQDRRDQAEYDAYQKAQRELEREKSRNEKIAEDRAKAREKQLEDEEKEKERLAKLEEEKAAILAKAEDYSKQQREKARKEIEAEEIATAQRIATAKTQLEQNAFKAVQNLSNVFFANKLLAAKGNAAAELEIRKKQFQVEKAFNVARATIDGARAVTSALTIPPPAGPLLAAANAVIAAAQVAAILATKFDGGSANFASIQAPNVSTPTNAPDVGTAAPVIHDQNTRLSESGQNLSIRIDNHINETDITDKQKRVGKLQSQAKVG